MSAPVGYEEVVKFYGDPDPLIRPDGTPSPIWEARMMSVVFPAPLPLGWDKARFAVSARVNTVIALEVERVFRRLEKEGLWPKLRTYDGGYNWRVQRGSSSKLSMHAFGAALDFDAATNRLGTTGDIDLGVVAAFEACGWTWGGRFQRRDCMHFQWAKSV